MLKTHRGGVPEAPNLLERVRLRRPLLLDAPANLQGNSTSDQSPLQLGVVGPAVYSLEHLST